MNSAAFGGWERKHSGLVRNILKCDGSVSRSGIPPDSISKRWHKDHEGELLEEIQATTPERELSSPVLMRSLPPPAAKGGGIH
jgi:prepilin-type processing-associated H-X9-DG protein